MKLYELSKEDFSTGYYDPSEDEYGVRKQNDVRKPLLTLKKINRLKRMRAMQHLENLKREDLLAVMYSGGGEDEGGGMGGPPGF